MAGETPAACGDLCVKGSPDSPFAEELKEAEHSLQHVLNLRHLAIPTTIMMDNSTDVHVGPRLHYNAPVTCNQHVKLEKEEPIANGDAKDNSNTGRSHDVRCLCWVLLAVLVVVVVLVVPLHFSLKAGSEEDLTEEPMNPNTTLGGNRSIISRSSWIEYPPKFIRNLTHPTPYVVIGHTAEQPCDVVSVCKVLLRNIYSYHVGTFEQPDIGYNFLMDSRGNVYEGRGWDATNIVKGFVLRNNIIITLFGNYVIDPMTDAQVQSLEEMLELGVRLGKLAPDYKLIAQMQVFNSQSPGTNVLNVIDKWPHRCFKNCEIEAQVVNITSVI